MLRLDGNQIKSLDGLKVMAELNELSLARNQLSSLEGLAKFCPLLEILDVAENRLSSVKRLVNALAPLAELVELRLEGNPLVEGNPTNYRHRICGGLPSLQFLDAATVVQSERATAGAADEVAEVRWIFDTRPRQNQGGAVCSIVLWAMQRRLSSTGWGALGRRALGRTVHTDIVSLVRREHGLGFDL